MGSIDERLSNIEYYVEQQLRSSEAVELLRHAGLELSDIFAFRIDRGPLQRRSQALLQDVEATADKQRAEEAARAEIEAKRAGLVANLDERRRLERERREALLRWEQQRREIEGSEEALGSLRNLQAMLAGVDEKTRLLSELKTERDSLFSDIYSDLAALRDSYRELFIPVQQYLVEEPLLDEGLAMRVDAVLRDDGFAPGLLALIDRSKRGAFFQAPDDALEDLLTKTDLDDQESTRRLVLQVVQRLNPEEDGRPTDDVDRQLRGRVTREAVYDWLFGLDYLHPHYALRFNDKEIPQLSPGERGAALLIFYLLVDRSNIPILLDQPEENLDNETVSRLLVPAIRGARLRRQVILVTHNPNLAVYCDADQVVLAELSRTPTPRIRYRSGGIEEIETRRWLVNVLEGTGPAFLKRYDKYGIGAGGELVLRGD